MLNNICESFNSTIDSMRDKAIVTILKRLMVYLMKKIARKMLLVEKWDGELGAKMSVIVQKLKFDFRFCICEGSQW